VFSAAAGGRGEVPLLHSLRRKQPELKELKEQLVSCMGGGVHRG